jgi:hypothetical protein
VALGLQALRSNTTASNNTAVGYQAGYTNVTGTRNTFIGEGAGYSTTSSFNTFIGNHAGQSTTGGYNTFFGDYAGYLVTTGTKNVILGKYDGSTAPISGTGSNYIVLADGDGNVRGVFDNSGNFLVKTTTAYGAIASTGSIAPAATPSTSWGIDFASSTTPPNYISFSSAATYDLAAGSGIVVIHNNGNGDAAVFITYGGATVKLGGAASIVAGTGGANEIGMAYNGGAGKYRINNGYGTTQFLYITTIRTRNAS